MKCEAVIFDRFAEPENNMLETAEALRREGIRIETSKYVKETECEPDSMRYVIRVGDTVSDIQAAKNAGAVAVGVIEGSAEMGMTREEYETMGEIHKEARIKAVTERYKEAGADYVIMDIRGVLDIIHA